MIGAIANPTKKVTIDFPIGQVKDGVKNISKVYKKYRMTNENPMFNQYTYEATEFLSLGVFIDINLTSQGDNRTEVNIEVRRKMGAFDTWVEVQNANEHIQKIIDGLSKLLTNPNMEVKEVKEESSWPLVVGIIIGLIILANLL